MVPISKQATMPFATSPAHMATSHNKSATAPANMRSLVDFSHAKRYSIYVFALKIIFPIVAALICLYFIASALVSYSSFSGIQLQSTSLEKGKLIMRSPNMAGVNKKNNPYNVKAQKAIQDLSNPDVVELEMIDAALPIDAKTMAHMTANSGIYNTKTEKMTLNDNVIVKGARGMDIFLENADIDVKSGSMHSLDPVKVLSKNTRINADSVRVENNGERIVFKKRVRMVLERPLKSAKTDDTNTQAQ